MPSDFTRWAGRRQIEAASAIAMSMDPTLILKAAGLTPDNWQQQLLFGRDRQILLNCCRQSGKSTSTAAIALHQALFTPKSLVLLLSPGQRQSGELFRKVLHLYNACGRPVRSSHRTERALELENKSRIVSLPGKEETVRSFSGVSLLILDEASRVADELYYAVRPMLAVSQGRLIALSSPFGQRGWFWREYTGTGAFARYCVTWHDCPRISADFIQEELRAMGQPWVDQEYLCLFTTLQGLVYPEFNLCRIDMSWPWFHQRCRKVGGIDFGWRNPFAAVWGYYDRTGDENNPPDCLYLTNERYMRETLMSEHVKELRKHPGVTWYADPSGADPINECRAAGMTVLRGNNDIPLGIAAVTARIRTGRLKIVQPSCPNIFAEAALYRYPSDTERAVMGEKPIDSDNHALGALRYLVSRLDHTFICKLRKRPDLQDMPPIPKDLEAKTRADDYRRANPVKPWMRMDNPALWPDRN